ncbi:hypothetical protein [Streptomyces sp. NPDC056660]|uniref:hypothetical protein n=1 Tax=Streptomyces sp. NPDC056660 TaxID=3345897 RepID=UPI003679C254
MTAAISFSPTLDDRLSPSAPSPSSAPSSSPLRLSLAPAGAVSALLDGAPVLPICCFRALPDRDGVDLTEYTEQLHRAVVEHGDFHLTVCHPNGEPYLRVAVNNYTTRNEHVDALLEAVLDARATLDA